MEPGMGNSEPVIELGKQKKSKAPVIVAILCVVLAVAGVGFGVFELMQNNNKNIDNLKIEIENSDGTKTELETDKISISDDKRTITIKDSKTGDYTIYRELVGKYVKWTWTDTDKAMVEGALNGDIDNPSYMAYVANGGRDGLYANLEGFNIYSLQDRVKKSFGKEMETTEELEFGCASYKKEDWGYVYTAGGCGGIGIRESLFDVIGVENEGDSLKIEISYGYVIGGPTGDDPELSVWSGQLSNGEEVVKTAEFSYNKNTDNLDNAWMNYFYEHPDDFDHYVLTFKKDDKHYYLESSAKVE